MHDHSYDHNHHSHHNHHNHHDHHHDHNHNHHRHPSPDSLSHPPLRFSTLINHVRHRLNGHATPVDRLCSPHAQRKQTFAASRGDKPVAPPNEHPVEYGG